MDVFIVTGASKGIGLSLSKQLMKKDHFIVCIARTNNEELLQLGQKKRLPRQYFECDLSNTASLDQLMDSIVESLPETLSSITLINNAGVIDPIGRTEDNEKGAIMNSITVNLAAPMVLSSQFINRFRGYSIPKKIVNVSSGAGRKSYSGWSSYCAGKAGLDHYSRVVSEEQQQIPHGVKIVSIAPGIIDTGMQEKIRESNAEDFTLLDQFITYKEQGLLSTPEETARKLIAVIESDQFFDFDVILDLRDF